MKYWLMLFLKFPIAHNEKPIGIFQYKSERIERQKENL